MVEVEREANVWLGQWVKIRLRLDEGVRESGNCLVVFFKGQGDARREIQKKQVAISNGEVACSWRAIGLGGNELCAPVSFEAQLPGRKRQSAGGPGLLHVWARSITVKITDAEEGGELEGALFRVQQGPHHKVYRYAKDDLADGMIVDLVDFSLPTVTSVSPFRPMEWIGRDGCRWELKARKLERRAVFLQEPERGKELPLDRRLERRQYVNLEPGDRPEEGSLVRILVGADRWLDTPQEMHVRITFSGPDGGPPSRRNQPARRLLNASWCDREGRVFRGSALLWRHDEPAVFPIELGLAGGDVCTISVGTTHACDDATLVITNWRKLAYDLFAPAADLSDLGRLSRNGPDFPRSAIAKARELLEQGYIEYSKNSARTFGAGAWPEILPEYSTYACEYLGQRKHSKKRAFIMEESALEVLGAKLTATIPGGQRPNHHTIIVCDHIGETEGRLAEFVGRMAAPVAELKLHGKKHSSFPREYDPATGTLRPGIASIEYRLVKVGGKRATRAQVRALGIDERWIRGVRQWSARCSRRSQLEAQDASVEFLSCTRIRLRMRPIGRRRRGRLDPVGLFEEHEGVVFAVRIAYFRRENESCTGMKHGKRGLMMFPTLHRSTSIHTCLVHELCHAIGLAYGNREASGFIGTNEDAKPIPGLPFRRGVPEGYVYNEHGHAGGHCAFGLSKAMRKQKDFEALYASRGFTGEFQPRCLNWGSDVRLRRGLGLCPECLETIRAQDLRDFGRFD